MTGMIILGINAFHGDSAAALFKDGQLVCAIEEERIRRIKHWAGFPSEAVSFCLQEAGIGIDEVDHIAVSRNPSAHLIDKVFYALMHGFRFSAIKNRVYNLSKVASLESHISRSFGNLKEFRGKIHPVEHHRSHLASSFFVSPYEEAALISVDGFGDFVSTMTGIGKKNGIEIMDRVPFPHSLGLFYQAMTQYLGFWKYGDEYKVMGLAPYGVPRFVSELKKTVLLKPNGLFQLNLDYFLHHRGGVSMAWEGGEPSVGRIFSDRLVQLLGPAREKEEEIASFHKDVAASVQALYEEAFFHLLNHLYRRTGLTNLCISGGCAQNSVANGKVYSNTPFKEIYVPPAGYDAGTAIGAALYFYHQSLEKPRSFMMEHAYWGPGFSSAEISEVLGVRGEGIENKLEARSSKLEGEGTGGGRGPLPRTTGIRILFEGREGLGTDIKISMIEDEGRLCDLTAQAISGGKIVGWFQGRTEWGPRALGNRSILGDPRRKDMKERLNLKIKRRESFRPFAPSILQEKVNDFFELDHAVPFMEKVFEVKKEKRELIPAVVHVDGTGRLQTVEKKTNLLYWRLISAFEKISGIPVLLNTSFNENEPIVNHPKEALDCFLRTRMDVLVLGHYFIERTT